MELFLSKFYARKTASLSKLTLHHGYEYLGHGEYYAGVLSGIQRVLHATEALRFFHVTYYTSISGSAFVSSYSNIGS